MRAIIAAVVVAAGFVGCSGVEGADTEPTLEITTPQRGTFAGGENVTVTGIVHDDGAVRVTVNGTDVTPAKDGTFTAIVPITPGIGILETHAIDRTGHDVRDVRAVVGGTLATADGTVVSQVGAQAGVEALRTIGGAIATVAEGIDFNTAVKAMNPVYNNTGCLGAKIDVTDIALANIGVGLTPIANALTTNVSIDNIVVHLHADYKVACLGGSTTITVHVAKARIDGDLGVTVTAGKIATSLANPTVALDGFVLDVSGVPSAIESLFNSKVRDAVAASLTTVVRDKVPPIADKTLAELVAKPYTVSVLGHDTKVTVSPSKVTLSATTGLFVSVDTKLVVTGGEGGMFVTKPSPITASLMAQARGLGVAIASDAVNQMFSGLWAANAFDMHLPIASLGVLGSILDADAKTIDLELKLPPTMTTQGTDVTLSVGDLIVTVKDDAGNALQTIAISLRTTLAAGPTQTGKLALTVGTPEVHAQVVSQADSVQRPLTDAQVEGLVSGVWGVVGSQATDALAKLPMPTFATIKLGAPTIQGRDGYVVADIALK